jgi:ABC-type glutathione transport system ATPase component
MTGASAASAPILEIEGLRKTYGGNGFFVKRAGHVALNDVSLSLGGGRGQVLAIVGESGSGKTTLARIILRLVKADAGVVRVAGEAIAGGGVQTVSDRRLRQLVQPIFQNPFEAFSLHLPVEEYLVRTAINLGDEATARSPEATIADALSAVGLSRTALAGKGIRAFSGGELQRISIARALIAKPRLIVADEPVSMVDASLRMTIVNLFRELSRELGVAFVYITHDLSTACYLSDQMAIMRHGEVVDFGVPDDILGSPKSPYTKALMDAIPTLDRRWID